MSFGGVLMVVMGVQSVAMGHFVMVSGFMVIALFVRFVRFAVVMGCCLVVMGSMVVMVVLRHVKTPNLISESAD
jgi:hypothetical protein